jgi:hypothetical protein
MFDFSDAQCEAADQRRRMLKRAGAVVSLRGVGLDAFDLAKMFQPGSTWTPSGLPVHKSVGSAAGLAPISKRFAKTDATEPGFEVPDRSPTPNTLKPASTQRDPRDDGANPFSPLEYSDVENADGAYSQVQGPRDEFLDAWWRSRTPIFSRQATEAPDHAAHADRRSIGWDNEQREPVGTNYGAMAKRAPRDLRAEVAALGARIAKAEAAGRLEHADDLRRYRRLLVRELEGV